MTSQLPKPWSQLGKQGCGERAESCLLITFLFKTERDMNKGEKIGNEQSGDFLSLQSECVFFPSPFLPFTTSLCISRLLIIDSILHTMGLVRVGIRTKLQVWLCWWSKQLSHPGKVTSPRSSPQLQDVGWKRSWVLGVSKFP